MVIVEMEFEKTTKNATVVHRRFVQTFAMLLSTTEEKRNQQSLFRESLKSTLIAVRSNYLFRETISFPRTKSRKCVG